MRVAVILLLVVASSAAVASCQPFNFTGSFNER
jgi:hypothetical protein